MRTASGKVTPCATVRVSMWGSITKATSPPNNRRAQSLLLHPVKPAKGSTMTKIVTRLFDNFSDAQHAVIELERVGVPHGDISLVSHQSGKRREGVKVREPHDHTAGEAGAIDAGVGAAAGGALGAAGGVLAGLGILAIPGLGPVVAAG